MANNSNKQKLKNNWKEETYFDTLSGILTFRGVSRQFTRNDIENLYHHLLRNNPRDAPTYVLAMRDMINSIIDSDPKLWEEYKILPISNDRKILERSLEGHDINDYAIEFFQDPYELSICFIKEKFMHIDDFDFDRNITSFVITYNKGSNKWEVQDIGLDSSHSIGDLISKLQNFINRKRRNV
jgi:hypothetical protein